MRAFGLGALCCVLIATHPVAAQLQTRQTLEKSCIAGDAAACTRLGMMLESGRDRPSRSREPDPKGALMFYERACKAGDTRGCVLQARTLEKGQAVPQNLAAAAALYGRACDSGEFNGCSGLARLHEQGTGVPLDPARAKTLYARAVALEVAACDRGVAEECLRLGDFHADGGLGLAKDPVQALRYHERACTLGDPYGCGQAASLVSQGAPGVARDQARAEKLHARSRELVASQCDAGNIDACSTLMTPIADYKMCLDPDRTALVRFGRLRAEAYLAQVENLGDLTGVHGVDPKLLAGKKVYMVGLIRVSAPRVHIQFPQCLGMRDSTPRLARSLGLEVEDSGIVGLLRGSRAGIIGFFLAGLDCDPGMTDIRILPQQLAPGGTEMAASAAKPGAGANSMAAAVQKQCLAGGAEACHKLGQMYARGDGVAPDLAQAAKLFERLCTAGRMEGCLDLALLLDAGSGIARDTARATTLIKQACSGGEPYACELVKTRR